MHGRGYRFHGLAQYAHARPADESEAVPAPRVGRAPIRRAQAAAELLSCALDKLESEGGSQQTACELLLSLAVDQFCAGAIRASLRTLERGAEIARRIGDAELSARSAYRLAGWLENGGIDEALVRGSLDQALSLLGHDQDGQRAALLARRAEVGSNAVRIREPPTAPRRAS